MNQKVKRNVYISLVILIALIILYVSLLQIQQSMFFYPSHSIEAHKELSENSDFEEIEIEYKKNQHLYGWFKYNVDKSKEAPLLIFFGGNASNSSAICLNYSYENIFKYYDGYNFLMVDYPGYGLSDGRPSDKSMFEAALLTYDYAVEMKSVDKDNIVVMGHSIGSGVATYLASQRDVKGLILLTPYDRALSLYNDTLNIFYGPLKLLARYKFNSIEYAKEVSVKPLIIASYDDEVIGYELSENLATYFKKTYKVVMLSEIGHNYILTNNTTLEAIEEYLKNILEEKEMF